LPIGIGLTAELVNGEYVLNGRKYWPICTPDQSVAMIVP